MFEHTSVFVKALPHVSFVLVPFPFAIRETVSRELDRLEAAGILEKVEHSDWAAL